MEKDDPQIKIETMFLLTQFLSSNILFYLSRQDKIFEKRKWKDEKWNENVERNLMEWSSTYGEKRKVRNTTYEK